VEELFSQVSNLVVPSKIFQDRQVAPHWGQACSKFLVSCVQEVK
jgi:hypothetical protein